MNTTNRIIFLLAKANIGECALELRGIKMQAVLETLIHQGVIQHFRYQFREDSGDLNFKYQELPIDPYLSVIVPISHLTPDNALVQEIMES